MLASSILIQPTNFVVSNNKTRKFKPKPDSNNQLCFFTFSTVMLGEGLSAPTTRQLQDTNLPFNSFDLEQVNSPLNFSFLI
jgi:hypothetical protein